MKTIGLIGGLSWESSIEYYRIINETVQRRLGAAHSARCLMDSFDFEEVEQLQHQGKWEELTDRMVASARALKAGGADFVVICSNTMHKMVDDIERGTGLSVLHIADATAKAIRTAGLTRVGLLGTRFTMEDNFYKGRLQQKFDLEVHIPNPGDREIVHNIIYSELVQGKICQASKDLYVDTIHRLVAAGSQGVILGCTEIGLLISQPDVAVPVFDTTYLHAVAAVDEALA
ncbi:aspartate/glutamate racemase family protein [Alicyclobacillaceae bacterium I2511]|nr:aspartate/glutamate racemase family protein [Alicyclobacillaceae bacterium I2511]